MPYIAQNQVMKRIMDISTNQELRVNPLTKSVKRKHRVLKTSHVHPCIFRGRVTLFYSRDLLQQKPSLFRKLQEFTNRYKICLKADRRTHHENKQNERRSNWLTIPILSLGLIFSTQNFAGEYQDEYQMGERIDKQTTNTLGIIPPTNSSRNRSVEKDYQQSQTEQISSLQIRHNAENEKNISLISGILFSHLGDNDAPEYINEDLHALAEYYSRFPEAVNLLQSIKGEPWLLQYGKNKWATQVTGTKLNIHSAKVIFDTRAAAQLRLSPKCKNNPKCIASPADALLHELLHVQAVLLDSDRFLAKGGMKSHLYPTLHEMDIIKSEKILYKKMEKADGVKRPQRTRHAGKIKASSCVTCIM